MEAVSHEVVHPMLRRDLLLTLLAKALALGLLYGLFFAPRLRPAQDDAATAFAVVHATRGHAAP